MTHTDEPEVTIMKRVVNCYGRKIRMEYYPDQGPLFCPACGEQL